MNLLKQIPNWLVWKYVQKEVGKKPSKVPFTINGLPREKDSPLAAYDEAVAVAPFYDGIGFALTPGCGVVALDFDNCVDAHGNIDPRVARLCAGTYTEYSPSRTGVRSLYAGNLVSHKDTDCKRGPFPVEVFGNTGYVTITGNVTPECQMFGLEEVVAPVSEAVLEMYRGRGWSVIEDASTYGGGSSTDADSIAGLEPRLGWTIAQAREYLFSCPASCGRDNWLKALMAVHHELGATDEAFALVDEWSATGENYGGTSDVLGRWRSFGRNAAASVTGKWLLRWRGECLALQKYDAVKEVRQRIAECQDEFQLREKLCHEIATDERLDDMGRESLAQSLFDKFKSLGTKYPISQCRKLIEPARAERMAMDVPEWAQGWVYVTDRDKFYRIDSDEWLTVQSFNAKFNRYMPRSEDGSLVKSAAWAALEDFQLDSVTRSMYIPWAGPLFEHDGISCVNAYRPSSVPECEPLPVGIGCGVEQLSIGSTGLWAISGTGMGGGEAKVVIDALVAHMTMLCGGRMGIVDTLLDWIAHNVQKPGVKIRWAPLIKGIPGDGKTLVATLLQATMGQPNVKNISPNVLATDFSDWAHGACVGVMEEIKLTGHNRYDILNKLKPYITNNTVTVHPKGQAEYNLPNTANYIAFTNFADAIPMEETDRRWMIVHSPFVGKEDLYKALGGEKGAGAHFDRLYDGIAAHRSDLRRWFLARKIADGFKPNGTAPITDERSLMIALSESPEEDAVKTVIEQGAEGVGADVLSSACCVAAAMREDSDLSFNTTTINRLLTKMGWVKMSSKVRWAGKTQKIWVKDKTLLNASGDVIREMLDKTVPVNTGGVPSF